MFFKCSSKLSISFPCHLITQRGFIHFPFNPGNASFYKVVLPSRGNLLEYAENETDLGVIINCKLNFDEQRENLLTTTRKYLLYLDEHAILFVILEGVEFYILLWYAVNLSTVL